ncbi:MAG: thioredoxin domain-containing protein [Bacteroidetes bacterium]|nr:thioredoxin domain-containing protein [Bacteroidota bacterium]
MAHTNRLIHESSPYLLQHAHNPVDWYPWGKEALERAKAHDKPILVSIGYAACHWCHVMERESFEDESVAAFMNQHFICIKIDREERPDLDHFFMDALQAISGNGGWPLNMFLTSGAHPFYGGTYFPPRRYANRISWMEVLQQIKDAYVSRRSEIEEQATNLLEYLRNSNQPANWKSVQFAEADSVSIRESVMHEIAEQLLKSADPRHGGFGHAPKFPQTFSLQYLLRYAYFTGSSEALHHVEFSLLSMMQGGLFDQVGGGWCRYSTDDRWLVPHFEKMTYDNALLLTVMTEAYQVTPRTEYLRAVEQTIAFMYSEMRAPEGGYYAALDADSEGAEGKFYTWSYEEWTSILGADGPDMAELFGITEAGNWEGVNIPYLRMPVQEWAVAKGRSSDAIWKQVDVARQKLMVSRSARKRPLTDDKIILAWNALYNKALSQAAMVFERNDWLEEAIFHMDRLIAVFYDGEQQVWRHTYSSGHAKELAMLDDVSALVDALIHVHVLSGRSDFLTIAQQVVEYADRYHGDTEGMYYWFSSSLQGDVPVRKRDVYDGAMPSGNAVMAWNLYRLGMLCSRPAWKDRGVHMALGMLDVCTKHPTSFGVWSALLLEIQQETYEVVVLGEDAPQKARELMRQFVPNKVVLVAQELLPGYPLLAGRQPTVPSTFFACKNQVCMQPVHSSEQALEMLLTKS